MNNLTTKDGATLDSREVSEMVGKEHKELLRDIRTYEGYLAESNLALGEFFSTRTYKDKNNQERPCYFISKKGCEFIAHKLTGQKGAIFTATYINRFHELESSLNQPIPQNLSPQLQLLINMELKQNQLSAAIEETKEEVKAIRDVIVINPGAEWRKETNKILTKIGNGINDYQKPRNEVYEALKQRGKCRPDILVSNLKSRALMNGMSKSRVNTLGILDVLENEPRLREIYINIVKEMAIKHKIA